MSQDASRLSEVQAPPAKTTTPHFAFLDGLRGLAALWVMLFHIRASNFIPNLTEALPAEIAAAIFNWGEYGVFVFFVLSGFVIAHSLRNAQLNGAFLRRFALRRWVRLTPPYYGAIAFVSLLSAYQVYRGWNTFILFNGPNPLGRFATHLLYLQKIFNFRPYDSVYWTLCLEVQFYLVFVLLLWLAQALSRKLPYARAWVFASWSILGALYNLGKLPVPFIDSIFWPWQFSFFLGVYAYWGWKRQMHWGWVYGYAAFIALTSPVNPAIALSTAFAGALILTVARLNLLSGLLHQGIFQFFGRISYSLYLTHVQLTGLVFSMWLGRRGQTLTQELLGMAFTIGICVAVATAFWWLIERPAIAWSRKLKRPSAPNMA